MSSPDDSLVSDAIVRYIGEDRSPFPLDEMSAVRKAHANEGLELTSMIVQTLVRSEAITPEEVAPFDDGLRERLYEKLRALFPGLSEQAVRAIAWRWGFLNLR